MSSGRALSSRWLGRVFNIERSSATSELPLYLCPAFRSLSIESRLVRRQYRPNTRPVQLRRLHTETIAAASTEPPALSKQPPKTLPLQCHGCGALSQTTVPNEAGYYDVSRKAVTQFLGLAEEKDEKNPLNADQIVQQALESVDVEALERQGINLKALLPERAPATTATPAADKSPLCDRCHTLIHHSTGDSIYHPSIESLQDTIDESPYKNNHVYHVLDAADFPMSLLSRLHSLLDVTLRTQNRRAKPVKFQHGRRMEMSFIISRSDLLAPRKEQVDSLMPYIKETLRDALGRVGGRVRLGNIHCVSAKRGWWTKDLKEDIWKRGGAGWMVGKANVGKSQLFEAVFPKGRMEWEAPKHQISVNVFPKAQPTPDETAASDESNEPLLLARTTTPSEEFSLLPPPQPETNYPAMPVVSPLPGTTASPIRVPFGNGRGELIDLPGLARSDLETHVHPDKRTSLIMKSRILPEQQVLKPGQSLLLGGLIRLTPRNVAPDDEELVFLAYAFTPIEPHPTATDKAVLVQTQAEDAPRVENIAVPGTGAKVRHAGAFQVRYDVTKQRTGPLTRREAVGLKVDRLPYRVLGIDILIEGCGWVEVVVQVRTRQLFPSEGGDQQQQPAFDLRPEPVNVDKKRREDEAEAKWPVIDVYSPEGKFIGYRPPMNAWALNKPRKETKSRPRKSMKKAKKWEKADRRASERSE
ncbi:hypothetical protein C8A00DRAFT_12407 [Chaetomidium leptoderma]|uniref:Genetic interactor of prohibitins 3, mitochondrial n=1 Tax=Chaetomidium leptoderma TaxID=669021 RepID=A0AAN6VTP0_9PEZI|nr:hypothetical protein C8A00DRAFT_12407 [Chaetomidium leptoderma]